MNRSFWKGKKVLVTGHTGFKGSWLSIWLQQMGASVVGYALAPPTDPNLFTLAHVGQGMTSIEGDVRDLPRLTSVMREHQPEVVFHLAAQSIVRRSYAFPIETFSTNVLGTANLLEAVRCSSTVGAVVCVTSDKCYEPRGEAGPFQEGDRLGGHDPYSSSKACAELVIGAYRASYFSSADGQSAATVVASVRAGNVVGGGDWAPDRLVPDIVRALAANQPVVIRNPHATRPWQHVLEPLSGYLTVAEGLWVNGHDYANSWNFGPRASESRPVAWIAERLIELWGRATRWEADARVNPHEDAVLLLDSAKAERLLGWRPTLDLAATLEWIAEWFLGYEHGESPRRLSDVQIERFARLQAASNSWDDE